MRSHSLYPVFTWVILGHLKKMFWFSDNGLKKKRQGRQGFYFFLLFPIHHGKGFYFQLFKNNANQFNSTILANEQHNSVSNRHLVLQVKINERLVVFSNLFYVRKITHEYTGLLHNSATVIVLSTGRIVHGTICLERNCTLKLTRTVFSLVAMLNFYFRFRLISHSNVCQNSSASPARLKT